MCFLFCYFSAVLFKLTVIFPTHDIHQKDRKEEKIKTVDVNSFLMSSEPQPGPSSAK
jgi:hypothetical protein